MPILKQFFSTGLTAPILRPKYGHFAKANCVLLNLAYDPSKFAIATMRTGKHWGTLMLIAAATCRQIIASLR